MDLTLRRCGSVENEILDVLAVAWRWICDESRERRKRR